MSSILLDNWGLQLAFRYMQGCQGKDFVDAFQNLLLGTVLWDKVYYIPNYETMFWLDQAHSSRFTELLFPLPNCLYCNTSSITDLPQNNEYPPVISQGAIEYLSLARGNHINYLPCPKRAQFLQRNNIPTLLFDRSDLTESLNKEIKEFYEEINSKLGKNLIHFELPLFADYVLKTSNGFANIVDAILYLRKTKEIKLFKQWSDDLDEALAKGDILEIGYALNMVPDIVTKYRELIESSDPSKVNVHLSLAPELSFDFPLPRRLKKSQAIFLVELAEFGLKSRSTR